MNLTPFFWTLDLLALLVTVFLALGKLAKARLRKQHPPAGQMVDVGGYRLHVQVEGQGSPTVVLESGAGGIGLAWELVRPALARVTRVVTYDRAGLGWSDPSPKPREAVTMAEELHTMLKTAHIPGPYILVGHSLGGPVARQFAARYPDKVSGLVMVDSAHEQQAKHFPARLVKMLDSMKPMVHLMKLVGQTGIFALNPKMVPADDFSKLPAQTVQLIRARLAASNSHLETTFEETLNVIAAKTQPIKTLGDLPLTVISHGQLDANAVPLSLGQEVRDEYERTWQELQREITALSTQGRQIIAERSGHNVIFDQPELVIESVLEMVESTRAQLQFSHQEAALSE